MASLVIKKILETRKITDYLDKKHIYASSHENNGKIKYLCPLHKEKTPSFYVYTESGDYQNFYCFGCLHEDEPIWAKNGLIRIGDIKAGDFVYDHKGNLQRVLCTKKQKSTTIGVSTSACKEPVWMTPDHKCLVVTKSDAIRSMKCIYANKYSSKYGYFYQRSMCDRKKRYSNAVNFSIIDAASLDVGDLVGFPVFSNRINSSLGDRSLIRTYTKGCVPKSVDELPANIKGARLYGLYLAEGSVCSNGRVLRFTYSVDEVKTLANETQQLLMEIFNLESTIREYPQKGSCEVDCCSVELVQQMSRVFGHGAGSKNIPVKVLHWEKDVQRSLLSGYIDGDGNGRGVSNTVSRNLSMSLFALSIQCEFGPCRSVRPLHCGKDGTFHKESHWLHIKNGNRLTGFFDKVDDVEYYFAPVYKIQNGSEATVVDISVENTETFITKFGAVHNCKAKYNIIHLYRDLEGVSLGSAIRALAEGLEVDINSEINSAIADIEADITATSDFSIADFALMINQQLYSFSKMVNNDPDCMLQVEKMAKIVDKSLGSGDIESLRTINDTLTDVLSKRYVMYTEEQENKIRMGICYGYTH